MTPRELLEFSCQIRTHYDKEHVKRIVNQIIDRLGLSACADQYVGGTFHRAISGGEKKRTSIGYELITEPTLLLLDEPTSGLDSSTALRIVDLLRKQANDGMAVLASIHQPAAEILFKFDRVILLSEGYTIYNGPPSLVQKYFQGFGLKMNRFVNPADKLSRIASEPKKVL